MIANSLTKLGFIAALAIAAVPAEADTKAAPDLPDGKQEGSIPTLGKWVKLPDYPIAVFEAQGTIMDCAGEPHLVVFGGFEHFPKTTYASYKRKIYYEATGEAADEAEVDTKSKWAPIKDMPHDSEHPLTHMAQAVDGDVIYLAGGYLGAHPGPSTQYAFSYNCTADEWVKLPDLPAPRAGGGMVYLEDTNALIFAGGGDRITVGGKPQSDIEVHIDHGTTWMLQLDDLEAGWTDLGDDMPDPRNHQGGVTSCGRRFWIGGQYEENEQDGNRVTANELVVDFKGDGDELESKWESIADLPLPLGHISASTMPYNCGILVVAGVTQQKVRSAEVLFWEPESNEWHELGAYPLALATPVCGIKNNHVYCATGGGDGKTLAYVAELLSE